MEDYTHLMAAAAEAAGIAPREIIQPRDKHVAINGIDMHYLDWGNAHLPPLVFLHGGLLTAHTWDMAALLLRDHYHIIAPDQRGHGDTGWTPEEELHKDPQELMLADTREFIDHLGYERVILVGMSMGGINTIRYAARHPERLSAVGIVDVAPELMKEGQEEMAAYRADTDILENFEDFVARSAKYMPHRPVAHLRYSLTHSLKQLEDGRWGWKNDPRPGGIGRRRGSGENGGEGGPSLTGLWDDLAQITAPAILFWGAQSKILSREVAERAVAAMPEAELCVIDPATHNVHSDNPGAFARELHSFLQRVLRG